MQFIDRKAKYPGRWTMKKSDGTSEVVTLVRNDEPIVEGTPMNAATLNELSGLAISIDKTLTIPGAAADAKETGDKIGELKEDLNDVRIKYTNLFKINPNVQNVTINNGSGTVYVNENYIDVEEGKPYFVYVKFKITNLINWVQGYVYARLIYSVNAGGWIGKALKSIQDNSEFSISYNFIAEKAERLEYNYISIINFLQ